MEVDLGKQVDLAASLAPLSRAGDDLLDRWDGRTLLRTLGFGDGRTIAFAAQAAARDGETRLLVETPLEAGLSAAQVGARIRAMFVLDPSELAALAELTQEDAAVGRLATRHPGVVPVLYPDPFAALVRSISAQQINLAWASTVRRRLAERFGVRHEVDRRFVYRLDPPRLADANETELRALQLTLAKARAVIGVARAAQAGELEPDQLGSLTDDELIAHLTRLRGIGRWSAEWFLARTLGRPRVVAGDLAVRKAIGRLYRLAALPTENEVRRLTEHWGAAATFAQALALHDLAAGGGLPPG